MYRSLVFVASVLLASSALGQQSHGAGISGGAGLGESIDYVREHWGPPDSVRLVAAVIWHGRSVWNFSVGDREASASRVLQDSAARLSKARHRMGGGTVTTHANAWIEYEESTRTVYVLNRAFAVGTRDSTLVLLVNSVDGLDGPPTVTPIMIPHGPYGPKSDSTTVDARDIGALHKQWAAVLQTNTDVRAFLGQAESR